MLDRSEWQKGLADEARALGVDIRENAPINREDFRKITDQYTWIIDSTGVPSITSLAKGFHRYSAGTAAIAAQYRLEGDFKDLFGKLKLGVENHYIGYYWIFPKSRSEANVGIISLHKYNFNLWAELDRILEKKGMSAYKKVKKMGGLCPIAKLDRLTYDNVLLTGDAAGLVSPLHGGGIDTACVSAKIAIQSILNKRIGSYESELNKLLANKLKGETELLEQWKVLNYTDREALIKIICDAKISLGALGLLNGKFDVLRKIEYVRNIPFLGKYFMNIKTISNLLPPVLVRWIFTNVFRF